MLLGIDHLVFAVVDPDREVDALAAALELEAGGGGEHPAWGTHNRLVWLGDTFVELLGIREPRLARTSWLGAPAMSALETGPALIAWAIASSDLDADVAALREKGATLGPAMPGERRRADGAMVRWRSALPPRLALDRPFLIEHDPRSAEWTSADRAARSLRPGRIAELRLPIDGIHGLTAGMHDRAVVVGGQRVVVSGPTGSPPLIRLSGLPSARFSRLGCDWVVG